MLAVGRNFLRFSFHFDTCTQYVYRFFLPCAYKFYMLISFMSFHCDTCTSAVVFFFVLCSQVLGVVLAVRPALSSQSHSKSDTWMHTRKSVRCLSIPKR